MSRLIQRTGRSGHGVGRVSRGIIISGDEDVFESAVVAKNAMSKKLEKMRVHDLALDVLATQIAGIAIEYYSIDDEKIYQIAKRAYPYRDLTRKEFTQLLEFLETLRVIWLNKTKTGYEVKRRKKTWTYYFENLSTIPDTRQYHVVSIIENEPIGSLDEEFVAEHGQSGNKFVCAGRAWKIIQVDKGKVIVEPIDDIESAIPAWEGELIPVNYETAKDVGKLRKMVAADKAQRIKEDFNIDSHTMDEMNEITSKQTKSHIVPDDKNILIENYKDFIIIHSCFGSLVNNSLGKYIAAILTAENGVSVNMKIDPYRIMLQTVAKKDDVKRILGDMKNFENVITASVERSSTFKWRFIHVARRFGIISRSAKYDKINVNKIVTSYSGSPAYKETMREVLMEKMNMEDSGKVIEGIKNGEIKLHISEGLSYLGELGLVQQFSEVMKPRMPEGEIFNAFKKRLLFTKVRLLCTNCGDYTLIKKVKDVEKQPECPKCSSTMIAVVRPRQIAAQNIVKKKIKKKQLTKEEMEEFLGIRRSADLVVVYGRRAVEALAGHGVGPQTAARILAMLHSDKEKFYKDVLAAEKQFARTKIYWK